MQSKKTIRNPFGIFGWPVLLFVIFILGFAPAVQQEKKYKVELTVDQWQAILYCVDKSTAEHTTVTAVSKLIADQINAQLAAEKKIADSLNKVPPKKN